MTLPGNESPWTPSAGLKESSETVLIESSHIRNLTASKITAGTINAHEIVLKQQGAQTTITAPANMAIIRSSDYNGSYNNSTNQWTAGSSGWVIAGNGYAEFGSASIRGVLKAGSVWIDSNNRWNRNASDTANITEFKVGSATKYLFFDGTNLTFTGNLSAAAGTFSGNLSAAGGTFSGDISAASGTFSGNISIGSGNSIFKADSNGIYLGNSTFSNAPFRVSSSGQLNATGVTITGNITATSGTFTGTISAAQGNVGGWSIEQNRLVSASGGMSLISSGNEDRKWRNKRSWSFDGQWRNDRSKHRG